VFRFFLKRNNDIDYLLQQGNALYDRKKYTSAIKKYARILQLDSKNFPSIVNTGMAYFELQKYDRSIPFFNRAIEMDNTNPWWYNYLSQSLQKCGDFQGSLDNAWQAVLLSENDNAHHINMAYTIYEISGETGSEKTDSFLKEWYEKYPENPVAKQCYKSFFYDENYTNSDPKYVEELFDVFAEYFDDVLHNLQYDSPKIIAEYLYEHFNTKNKKNISILDLGCGSGLCGKYIKNKLTKVQLYGVDISAKMLEKAAEKNVYDNLLQSDITDCFTKEKLVFDAVVASDVLTYFGELETLFKKVDSLLKKNSAFIFTVTENKTNDFDFFLMPSSRFVHSEKYVDSIIKKYNFKVKKSDKKILRKEGDKDIEGIIYQVIKQ